MCGYVSKISERMDQVPASAKYPISLIFFNSILFIISTFIYSIGSLISREWKTRQFIRPVRYSGRRCLKLGRVLRLDTRVWAERLQEITYRSTWKVNNVRPIFHSIFHTTRSEPYVSPKLKSSKRAILGSVVIIVFNNIRLISRGLEFAMKSVSGRIFQRQIAELV